MRVWIEEIVLPTYMPAAPDKNPMFLDSRVYQGSSGKVYPLPFTDRIADTPIRRKWKAVWLENEFLKVMILPELGGRIHRGIDKTNGYDFIYYQPVIKPALVGLAGPWISGGIEFNWPQHHRPATFLPVDYQIEEHADGACTVWCSDHDPMARMKGMHGVCLHPGKAVLELKVRAYNRTALVQTFLWWANVATRVHELYQSFFPSDVYYVADHAKRATSAYPLCQGVYYGVDYGRRTRGGLPSAERPRQFVPPHCAPKKAPRPESLESGSPVYAPNDLSWYANISTPCSYMCMGSKEDFFGGYDYKREAGLVHVANRYIAPGKKQWTWGNHEFGYAWDRNLTDADQNGEYGPYIELMAGVYTDNQPDFSFLRPGETKTWSQYWYPIRGVGPPQHANLHAAVRLERIGSSGLRVAVATTRPHGNATVELLKNRKPLRTWVRRISPAQPFVERCTVPRTLTAGFDCNSGPNRGPIVGVRVRAGDGTELIDYEPKPRSRSTVPAPATEPLPPSKLESVDELFITGLHLEQYRHATRSPAPYWKEALRRDPFDSRCNNAIGLWHLRRGEFRTAEGFFRKAIERLTSRNPNPYDSEPYYNLGLCLRYQLDAQSGPSEAGPMFEQSYEAFYKSTWSQPWTGPGYHALAELDCRLEKWETAVEHLDYSLRLASENLRARDLKALVLRRLGREEEAAELLSSTLALDPLDWWARLLSGDAPGCDLQACLDIAHDLARAGFYHESRDLLSGRVEQMQGRRAEVIGCNGAGHPCLPDQNWGAAPLVAYTCGWLSQKLGETQVARRWNARAAALRRDYCFPARLEEIAVLESAMRLQPSDARAAYYLGNLFYDRGRPEQAINAWQRSARLDPAFATVWRNLGIAWFNVRQQPAKARAAYERAFKLDSNDARLLYERDQLWKRMRVTPSQRLTELERYPELVNQRDDLSVELCALYNQTGQSQKALALINSRKFQPWEGGEGAPLGQHVRSHLLLGQEALRGAHPEEARAHFEAALEAPMNLGEAKHLLANQSDVHYWLGCALAALGKESEGRERWHAAANFQGDFQEMSVRRFSEMTYYSALAWQQLGKFAQAKKLLRALLAYALNLQQSRASVDYFATSVPALLLFQGDLQFAQDTTALFLQAQAWLGLGKGARARALLKSVLKRDPNHAPAADLLRRAATHRLEVQHKEGVDPLRSLRRQRRGYR